MEDLIDYETFGIIGEGSKLRCWICVYNSRGYHSEPWNVDPLNVVIRCPNEAHTHNVRTFLHSTHHPDDRRHQAIQWFGSRINKLDCEIGKQEVRSLFFVYSIAPFGETLGTFRGAVDRLDAERSRRRTYAGRVEESGSGASKRAIDWNRDERLKNGTGALLSASPRLEVVLG
jgi:hypothetical protein